MIKYKLRCRDCETYFDSWFSSSIEFEKLKKKKFLNCHFCDSLNVEKTLMSPSIVRSKKNDEISIKSKKYNKIKNAISQYQKFIKKNFKYVGENFAYEARTIHYSKKKKSKGIYGSASKEDLKELKEEGIDAQMIPWIDEKEN